MTLIIKVDNITDRQRQDFMANKTTTVSGIVSMMMVDDEKVQKLFDLEEVILENLEELAPKTRDAIKALTI